MLVVASVVSLEEETWQLVSIIQRGAAWPCSSKQTDNPHHYIFHTYRDSHRPQFLPFCWITFFFLFFFTNQKSEFLLLKAMMCKRSGSQWSLGGRQGAPWTPWSPGYHRAEALRQKNSFILTGNLDFLIWAPAEKTCRHKQNMQTPHRKAPVRFQLRTILCNILPCGEKIPIR